MTNAPETSETKDIQTLISTVDAINRVQAVIEFNVDGTIIDANDNFLNAMGYRLDEIKGKHHWMFAETELANSTVYKEFWQKLNKGEFDSGEYKRLGKDGKEVWIQASYNPILDMNGKPYKVVKYATDITARKLAIAAIKESIMLMAKGDLTTTVTADLDSEFSVLAESMNSLLANLNGMMTTIREAADNVFSSSRELALSNSDLRARTESQASSLEQTASAME